MSKAMANKETLNGDPFYGRLHDYVNRRLRHLPLGDRLRLARELDVSPTRYSCNCWAKLSEGAIALLKKKGWGNRKSKMETNHGDAETEG